MSDKMTDPQTQEILGNLSKQLFELQEDNRALDVLKKTNNEKIDPIKTQILEVMESEGLEKCGTNFGSLTRKVDVHPNINDFPAFFNWIFKAKAFEFIQKRVNAAPVREMLKQHNELPPGIDTYMKEGLLTRIKPEFRSELESKKGDK